MLLLAWRLLFYTRLPFLPLAFLQDNLAKDRTKRISKTRALTTAAGSNVGEIQKLFLPYFLNRYFQLKSWTFLRAVGRFTLGISLSFPLLIRGAVESRELCGEEYGCWWPFNIDGTLVEPEPWNGVVVPTAETDSKVSLQAQCEYVYMYPRFRLLSVTRQPHKQVVLSLKEVRNVLVCLCSIT